MHTRRFGAFLAGAWLIGYVPVWFVNSQSQVLVERTFSDPPAEIQRTIDEVGRETVRQILRFEAAQLNRRIDQIWEVMQMGLGAALLVTAVLTPRRSRVVIAGAALMITIVAMNALYVTPAMHALAGSFDFLPPTAALQDRENHQTLERWHTILQAAAISVSMVVTVRLMFDFHNIRGSLRLLFDGRKRRVRRSAIAGP